MQELEQVNHMLENRKQNYSVILPDNINADAYINAVKLELHKNPALVTKATRTSLFAAVQRCARDGLVPNAIEAVFLLFGQEVVYMPMYRGMLKQMYESGLETIQASVVYSNDQFIYELGDNPQIKHVPFIPQNHKETKGNPIATYAIAKLKTGGVFREVIYQAEIDQIRKSTKKANPIWEKWHDEMCKKTVIRRMSKRFPNLAGSRLLSVIQSEEYALQINDFKEEIEENKKKISRLDQFVADHKKKEEEEEEHKVNLIL